MAALSALCSARAGVTSPLSTDQAMQAFELADPELTIELVASEPDVVDPIGMAFDADGRMYVLEMRGFQLGPNGESVRGLGRVRLLEDRDHDGFFEFSTVFVEGLYHPSAVMPFDGGILVGCAPDIIFFRDSDGDGQAEIRSTLFTGFGIQNHERLLNSFQWGLDNWIHGCGGGNGGQIRPAGQTTARPISVNGRDFRFRRLAVSDTTRMADHLTWDFESASGGGQFGLTADNFDRWLTCANSNHVMQIMLPEAYLRACPSLAVPAVTIDIPDHEPAAKLYRISPLEEWRVVRTRQRAASPNASRYPQTELVPGGYVTAACGIHVYNGDALPDSYRGNSFVCDSANNVVHRDVLSQNGLTFIARRGDPEKEFLASRDNWFRPTACETGPDGCLYIVDMQRGIIETPDSIPPDILKTIDMQAGTDHGRIYRIRPKHGWKPPAPPRLSRTASSDLVELLGHPNRWHRLTAQRLLVERQDRAVLPLLTAMAQNGSTELARLHALCTLDGLHAIDVTILRKSMGDAYPQVRAHALRLAESLVERPLTTTASAGPISDLHQAVTILADDPDPHVRFQLALTLGTMKQDQHYQALVRLIRRDASDRWMRIVLLIAACRTSPLEVWQAMDITSAQAPAIDRNTEGLRDFIRELLDLIAVQAQPSTLEAILRQLADHPGDNQRWWRTAVLDGLRLGLERVGKRTLDSADALLSIMTDSDIEVRKAGRRLGTLLVWPDGPASATLLQAEMAVALDRQQPLENRIIAVQLAARGLADRAGNLVTELIVPEESAEAQKAVARAVVESDSAVLIRLLLGRERWQTCTPAVQQTIVAAVLGHNRHIPLLLEAIGEDHIPAWALAVDQRQRLIEHADPAIQARARELLTLPDSRERQAVYDQYRASLDQPGNATAGREVFRANCAVCHRLEGFGSVVGPDLLAVRDRDPDVLLSDILLPSKAITAGYGYYTIDTLDGESFSGVIAAESANTITLRMAEGHEKNVLRTQIQALHASQLSMMPDELETAISPQQMADLIAYLKAAK